MPDPSTKPVIFISYAHADEPDKPMEGEVQWLSFVRRYLQPAVKHGIIDVWADPEIIGGADWTPEIEKRLFACDIFLLLVSANSMGSDYVAKEIAIIRGRQTKGEHVHLYPLLLTPTPDAALEYIKDKHLRPHGARPLSTFPYHERLRHMTEAANEIAKIAQQIVERKRAQLPRSSQLSPVYVHTAGLPDTTYERLVGRAQELKQLNDAWTDRKINIVSLIADGGAGKSALVNEWLRTMQANDFHGVEAVLGWSFYDQGSKERATSADEFLSWSLRKLGISVERASAAIKGEFIAEAIAKRRVLLTLDGVEALQHGPGSQIGQLKDLGLRSLLRRFATVTQTDTHGLVVLTSRVAIADIVHWKDSTAPIVTIKQLTNDAGASLLRENNVWGIDRELKLASSEFGGHPLALSLLASFLKETQFGDVRRRDHIRAFVADPENPLYDHVKRVMESYEREWLHNETILLSIMHIVGLFDRPASNHCVQALRNKPLIEGLNERIIDLDDAEWQRAVNRLREVRLLLPSDASAPDTLNAHPLVREWFGDRLKKRAESAWVAAHGRLYEHLRNATDEGAHPTIEDLAPLYQAIVHGCRAARHEQALMQIMVNRLWRWDSAGKIELYSRDKLGAVGSDLAALSWFFDRPYTVAADALTAGSSSFRDD